MRFLPTLPNKDDFNSPEKLGKLFKKAAARYFWPRTLTGLFLVYSCVQPNLGYWSGAVLYPNVDDYLRSQGVPEDARKKIIPTALVRVRPAPQDRTLVDHAHAILFESPTYLGAYMGFKQTAEYSAGYASPAFYCFANIATEKGLDIRGLLSSITGLQRQSLRQLPVSDKEMHLQVAIHEIGHCHLAKNSPKLSDVFYSQIPDVILAKLIDKNKMSEHSLRQSEGEDYSDHISADVLEYMNPKSHLRDYILAFRSISFLQLMRDDFDFAHDNALILDAQKRGVPEPTKQEIVDSRKEVAAHVRVIVEKLGFKIPNKVDFLKNFLIPDFNHHVYENENNDRFIRRVRIVRDVLQENPNLSSLAKRRLELFLDGMKYFSPDVFKIAIEGPKALAQNAPMPS